MNMVPDGMLRSMLLCNQNTRSQHLSTNPALSKAGDKTACRVEKLGDLGFGLVRGEISRMTAPAGPEFPY
jgi:hypothetical protein